MLKPNETPSSELAESGTVHVPAALISRGTAGPRPTRAGRRAAARVASVVAAGALVFTGCGSDDSTASDDTAGESTTSTTAADDEASAGEGDAGDESDGDLTAACADVESEEDFPADTSELVERWGPGIEVMEELSSLVDEIGGASFEVESELDLSTDDAATDDAATDGSASSEGEASPVAEEFVEAFDADDVDAVNETADRIAEACGDEAAVPVAIAASMLRMTTAEADADFCADLEASYGQSGGLRDSLASAPDEVADALGEVAEVVDAVEAGGTNEAVTDSADAGAEITGTLMGLGIYMEGACGIEGAAAETMLGATMLGVSSGADDGSADDDMTDDGSVDDATTDDGATDGSATDGSATDGSATGDGSPVTLEDMGSRI